MIKANIIAEIEALECKIEQKRKELDRINNIITKQAKYFQSLDDERNHLIYKRSELLEQLEDKDEDKWRSWTY